MLAYVKIGAAVLVAILGIWLNRKLTKANEDRLRAEIDEQANQDLQGGLKNAYTRQKAHDAATSEILSGPVSDDRASNLLSFPVTPSKIPNPPISENQGSQS